MAVQNALNNNIVPFIRSGDSVTLEAETIAQDAARSAALAPFTVLGKIAVTVPTTGTADAGNTGDGTVTAVALVGGVPRAGTWEIECTAAVTNGGTFKLTDPGGNIVDNALVMTAGAGAATVFISNGFTFTITDGSTDFASGDVFTVTVTASGKWGAFDVDAVNGLQIPRGIYLGYELTAAEIVAGNISDNPVLVGGACTIDSGQLVIENSATLATVLSGGGTVRDALAAVGIFAESTVDADEYENA